MYNIFVNKRKELKTMRVKVYVNWIDEEILSEKEFQNRVNEVVAEIMEDEDDFSRICDREFTSFELFCMDSKNKDDIEKVESIIRERIKEDYLCDGWENVEIEI